MTKKNNITELPTARDEKLNKKNVQDSISSELSQIIQEHGESYDEKIEYGDVVHGPKFQTERQQNVTHHHYYGAGSYPMGKSGTINKRWQEEEPVKAERRKNTASVEQSQKTTEQKPLEFYVVESQEEEAVADSKDIIHSSLQHFANDKEAVAIALEIPEDALNTILDNDHIAFTANILKKSGRLYRNRITTSDPLTGLLNRNAFIMKLDQMTVNTDLVTVLFIDLDKFKPVNDTYGHKIGDKLLQSVGNRIKENVPVNSIVCRLGGDEFAVAIPDLKNNIAGDAFAKAVESCLSLPFHFNEVDEPIMIGGSAGISRYGQNGKTAEELIDAADKLMYIAKSSFDKPPTKADYIYYYLLTVGVVFFYIIWALAAFNYEV